MTLTWFGCTGSAILACLGWTWFEASTFIVVWESVAKAIAEVNGSSLTIEDGVLCDECPVRAVLLIACTEGGVLVKRERAALFGLALFKDAFALGVSTSNGFAEMRLCIGIHFVIGIRKVGSETILEITCCPVREERRELWIRENLFPASHAMLVASVDECLRLFGRPSMLLTSVTFRCFSSKGRRSARAGGRRGGEAVFVFQITRS